ncbi:hypothetical protein LFREDSHE_22190 [Shewanella baltica]
MVSYKFLERINKSALTEKDLNWLSEQRPIRPQRWYDYIYERHYSEFCVRQYFPPEIPFSLLDPRLYEIALSFKKIPIKVNWTPSFNGAVVNLRLCLG